MNVELIQATPEPVNIISKIASICYDSDPADPMKLVNHLYRKCICSNTWASQCV